MTAAFLAFVLAGPATSLADLDRFPTLPRFTPNSAPSSAIGTNCSGFGGE